MSKISANTLRDKDGAVEVPMKYPVRGSAKAWVNINMSGTMAARDSLNIASVTDLGVGNATVTLSSAYAAVDAALAYSAINVGVDYADGYGYQITVSTIQVRANTINTLTSVDANVATVLSAGDLA